MVPVWLAVIMALVQIKILIEDLADRSTTPVVKGKHG
jgi:hypothetical protein